ncbi:MAG: NUDIX hydrolase [Bacteroidia bacterium]|nr:NUDIX hydrolase [Bacteroidia bacterium]MDW8088387.1 NUDIX hydrolase [Bacteroidia bacterium]
MSGARWLWEHPLLRIEERFGPDGERRLVVHRGAFVAVCLHLIAEGGEAFLMVRQQRPTAEEPFYEHPAGMIEAQETPLQAALREVAEETGWLLAPQDLTLLTPQPLYPSPAFWQEVGYFFAVRKEVPLALLKAYATPQLRQRGKEKVELLAVPPSQVLRLTRNLQTVAHTLLYYAYLGAPYRDLSSFSPYGAG